MTEPLSKSERSASPNFSEAVRWLDLPDPEGEKYDDGSYDYIIGAEWPARYPTREDHVELHVDGFDIDLSATQLQWIVDNAPALLGWMEGRRS